MGSDAVHNKKDFSKDYLFYIGISKLLPVKRVQLYKTVITKG